MDFKTILLIFFLIMLVFSTGGIIHENKDNTTEKNTLTYGLDENGLRDEFNRISNLPYSEYKCRERSDLLYTYIRQNDPYSTVYTVSIQHKNNQYSHVYVVYQNVAFDPTSVPPLYRIPLEKYNAQLDVWGFNRDNIVSMGVYGG